MKIKFGDIVQDVKCNIDRENNPFEFYVAGDHLDSEDLTIRRRGRFSTDDVGPAFVRKFTAGQILYGSRRTYLKKVAVADFDGICANTTFVFESKDPSLFDQRLLPFLMLSDNFTKWSVSHSKGSTNPYILFSDLAEFEFDLPSLADQKKLADKLWAAYRLKESYKKLLASMDELANARFVDMFLNRNLPTRKLRDLLVDSFPGEWGCDDKTRTGTKVIRTTNFLNDGTLDLSNVVTRNIPENKVNKKSLNKGDIILERSGGTPNNPVGRVVYFNNEGTFLTNNFTQTLRCGEDLNSLYLFYYLYNFYKSDVNFFRRISSQTTGIQNLNMKYYMNIDVVVPNKDQQELFVLFLMQLDKSKSELKKSIAAIDDVIKSLIN